MKKKSIFIKFSYLLVFVYIILEGFFWLWFTKPLFKSISSLGYFRKVAIDLKNLNPYIALFIFIFLVLIDDIFIVNAAIQMTQGNILVSIVLYLIKILIDITTIWFFSETKESLMKFKSLEWIINKISNGIYWIRSRKVYIRTKVRVRYMKKNIKIKISTIRRKYFSHKGEVVIFIKNAYKKLKTDLSTLYRTKKHLVQASVVFLVLFIFYRIFIPLQQ